MVEKLEELQKDLAELQGLEGSANRHKVKDILSLEIRKITAQIGKIQEEVTSKPSVTPSSTVPKRYQVKLNTYSWDQSGKFVKFYVSLPKVHTIPAGNVICNFTTKSLELSVSDLENKDYTFVINKLLGGINPESSNIKIKTDMVVINGAKLKGDHWSHVTELEKKSSDSKAAKLKPGDNDTDPNDGLMSIMKNMYETGDDEMKRTIAKAWTETQNKPQPT